jgi:hypothetical protein
VPGDGQHRLLLRCPRDAERGGERVAGAAPLDLAVDTSRLHFFDPATGETIGHPLTV